MKPSISTLYFRELDPFQMVPLFAKHGWDHLELSECHGHDLAAEGDPARGGQVFGRFAADHGVTFLQGHLPVQMYHNTERSKGVDGWFDIAPASDSALSRVLEAARRRIDLFAAIGIQVGVLHMGGAELKGAGWSDGAIFERRVQALTTIAEYAADRGIVVCLENMNFLNCDVETFEEINRFIVAAGVNNLGICLDTGHALMAGGDCVEFALRAGSLVKAVHIHENGGTIDEHLLPYERGTIPWGDVLGALRQIEYQGLLNLEVIGRRKSPMPVREARLDYARALAYYLAEQTHNRVRLTSP